jgi:protein TonB
MEGAMSTATVERERIEVLKEESKVVVMRRPVAVPELFGSVLLETSGEEKRRRRVSAMLSMTLQCLALGVAVLIPLWFTDALPKQEFFTLLVAPPPPPPPPAAPAARAVQRAMTEMVGGQLRVPGRIPDKVQMIREDEPAPTSGVVGGVPGGIPGGQLGGVIGGILNSAASVAMVPKLASAVPLRIRVSQGVTKGQLIEKIEPKYPPLARSARIQGEVVLAAVISKTGEIQNLELVSGPPILVPAALDAVRQWRYRPFLLNGVPAEVETVVTVTFRIAM